jgi:Predicted permeases
MDLITVLIIILASFTAGFIGSILGIGGGIIIVPTLTNLGYPIERVIPVSLLAILLNSIISSVKYSMKNLINYKLGLNLSILTIFGAIIGSMVFIIINKKILYILFGIIIIILAILILKIRKIKINKSLGFLMFIFGGIISNLLGVGGGVLFTPLLNLIFNLDLKKSVATSLLMIGIVTGIGTLIYFYERLLDLYLGLLTATGIIIGSFLGSSIMISIKEKHQRLALTGLLSVISFSMIYRGII